MTYYKPAFSCKVNSISEFSEAKRSWRGQDSSSDHPLGNKLSKYWKGNIEHDGDHISY